MDAQVVELVIPAGTQERERHRGILPGVDQRDAAMSLQTSSLASRSG